MWFRALWDANSCRCLNFFDYDGYNQDKIWTEIDNATITPFTSVTNLYDVIIKALSFSGNSRGVESVFILNLLNSDELAVNEQILNINNSKYSEANEKMLNLINLGDDPLVNEAMAHLMGAEVFVDEVDAKLIFVNIDEYFVKDDMLNFIDSWFDSFVEDEEMLNLLNDYESAVNVQILDIINNSKDSLAEEHALTIVNSGYDLEFLNTTIDESAFDELTIDELMFGESILEELTLSELDSFNNCFIDSIFL